MKHLRGQLVVMALICGWAASAHAAMHWQPAPHKEGIMHMRNAPEVFRLIDGKDARVTLMSPDLSTVSIHPDVSGQVTIKPDGMEYFHVLIARHDTADTSTTAIQYFHSFGRPTSVSPSLLVNSAKSELEIIPDPLPREHWLYRAAHRAKFIIRFKGKPLANQVVELTTENGSRQAIKTNASGRLAITLPDDFPITHAGYRHNQPAELLLDTTYTFNGHRYRTLLSAPYIVNSAHWQSFSGGLLVAGGGMLMGGLMSWRLARRRKAVETKTRKREQS